MVFVFGKKILIFLLKGFLLLFLWLKKIAWYMFDKSNHFFYVDDNFWNQLFDKEFLKYKDRLNVIFLSHPPFETNNINIVFNHVFRTLILSRCKPPNYQG
jgi:hypothetical protein